MAYFGTTQNFWLLRPESPYAHWIRSDYFFFSYFLSISPLLLWCLDLSKIPKIILKIIGITLLILVMVNQFLAGFFKDYFFTALVPVTVLILYLLISAHQSVKEESSNTS